MQVLPKWRTVSILNTTTTHLTLMATATPLISHLASFHSTGASFEKWKTTFKVVVKKKQLSSKDSFSKIQELYCSDKNYKTKHVRAARRDYRQKEKFKPHKNKLFEDFDEHERIFKEKSGEQCFTWSFRAREDENDWRETSGHGYFRNKTYQDKRRMEFDDKCSVMGTAADRRILGLPLAGPLRIEDVKAAFRFSALKWHPDKNQSSSRADAEEKFKQCANAYKSLCSAFSTP